jgi:hypothetical protein
MGEAVKTQFDIIRNTKIDRQLIDADDLIPTHEISDNFRKINVHPDIEPVTGEDLIELEDLKSLDIDRQIKSGLKEPLEDIDVGPSFDNLFTAGLEEFDDVEGLLSIDSILKLRSKNKKKHYLISTIHYLTQ